MDEQSGSTSLKLRRTLARDAFLQSAVTSNFFFCLIPTPKKYDGMVSEWMLQQGMSGGDIDADRIKHTRNYVGGFGLKYGCNPHQKPSNVFALQGIFAVGLIPSVSRCRVATTVPSAQRDPGLHQSYGRGERY